MDQNLLPLSGLMWRCAQALRSALQLDLGGTLEWPVAGALMGLSCEVMEVQQRACSAQAALLSLDFQGQPTDLKTQRSYKEEKVQLQSAHSTALATNSPHRCSCNP